MRTARWTPWLYLAPALLVFVGLVVAPIIWSVYTSVFRWNGIGPMQFVGLSNYLDMVGDKVFRTAFVNNLVFTALGTCVQMVLGMAMALLLLSIRRFRDLIKVAYFIPCIVSSVAISQIFIQLLAIHPEGVVNALLSVLHLESFRGAFLSDPNLALVLVTLVDAYKYCAIYMVIYYSAFLNIDSEVLDAATIDGCNWWQQYVYIKFPLIKAVVVVTLVMLVSGTLKGFDVSYVMTRGGPGASSELVATYLYKTLFNSSDFGYGSAIGVFLAVECLVLVAVLRKVFRVDDGAEAEVVR